MSRALLIRIAATLSLITCMGHAIGTFMAVPPDQTAMHATIATMKATLVPMPVGAARIYMQILDGNNICTAVFLFAMREDGIHWLDTSCRSTTSCLSFRALRCRTSCVCPSGGFRPMASVENQPNKAASANPAGVSRFRSAALRHAVPALARVALCTC